MKKISLLLFFVCALLNIKAEEAFYIKNYDVKITISDQGYFDVKETIVVYFTQSRRGIIRQIPFRYDYAVSSFQKQAQREGYKYGYYDIIFENITVKDKEFTVTEEVPYKNIKIGSVNKYITGEQTYEISYRVWGALNKFTDSTEWVWNIVGNEWDCPIENVSYQIILLKPYTFKSTDVLGFKGKKGSTDKIIPTKISSNLIFGFTTNPLKNYEGITLALRFKNDYFKNTIPPIEKLAKKYYFNNHYIQLDLHNDGSIDVVEDFDLQFLNPQENFYKFLEKPYGKYSFYASDISIKPKDALDFIYIKTPNYSYIKIFSNNSKLEGNVKFQLKYKIWGAYDIIDDTIYTYFPLLTTKEPVKKSSFLVNFPQQWNMNKNQIAIFDNLKLVKDITYNFSNNCLTGFQNNSVHNASNNLYFFTNIKDIDLSKTPANVYAKDFFIKSFINTTIVEPDGDVHFKYKADVVFMDSSYSYNFRPEIYSEFYRNQNYQFYQTRTYAECKVPFPPLLAYVYKPKIKDVFSPNENFGFYDYYAHAQLQWYEPYIFYSQKTYDYQFTIFNILKREKNYYIFNYPVFTDCTEPVEKGIFEFYLPNTQQDKIIKFEGYIVNKEQKRRNVPLVVSGNKIFGEVDLLMPGEVLMLEIYFSKDYLSIPLFKSISFFFVNNKALILVLFFFIFLFTIWFFFGRDKKRPIVVQYYPPEGLTSAEAGYIWDNKLHERDLISLIYQWAGQGIIEIKDLGNKDYELKKLQGLPANAKVFEKTMFDGLFRKNDSVKVSNLRNVFYITLDKAFKEMKKYSKQNRFFTPGTLGFKVFLKVMGWIFGIVTFISFLANVGLGDMLWPISLGIITIMLFLFARIMPQRAPFGAEKYWQLQGFYEFIKRAEILRLEALLKENPKYFEQTLAYATVMGLSDHWAEKFKTLISEPPSYYKGYRGEFNTVLFMRRLRNSMYKMESDMTYKYTPSSSYSGSSSSFKSSYKSSAGGGFSSFRGGGFSGGGFGGGGGKSW